MIANEINATIKLKDWLQLYKYNTVSKLNIKA